MFKFDINFLLSSKNEIYMFQLTTDKEIKYNIFDSTLSNFASGSIDDVNVLTYSLLIDENDSIHLIALLDNGNLNYHLYNGNEWSKSTISKFDFKSNLYSQIEILKIDQNLHIIYNYSNLINSNVWTIQHVILDSKERHNAIRYISGKNPDHFIVSKNSQGAIHLLYTTLVNNSSQIFHNFYNPFSSRWTHSSKQISSEGVNSIFPFLFIDSQDNLHGLWLEESRNKQEIKYMKMSSLGKEKYIWKIITLPYIDVSRFPPIIIEEKNILKLFCKSGDSIIILSSRDFGNSWSEEERLNISEDIILTRVSSNMDTDVNQIKYGYSSISPSLKFYFNTSGFDIGIQNSLETHEIDTSNEENFHEELPSVEYDDINILKEQLRLISDDYFYLESRIKDMSDTHMILIERIDELENKLNNEKNTFFRRFFG